MRPLPSLSGVRRLGRHLRLHRTRRRRRLPPRPTARRRRSRRSGHPATAAGKQDIIARHLARTLLDATCADHARWWTQWEAAHNAATSPETRDDAARPAFALCGRCDSVEVCAAWAEMDTYTGLAAGAAYRKGSKVDHTLRYGRPERRGSRKTVSRQ